MGNMVLVALAFTPLHSALGGVNWTNKTQRERACSPLTRVDVGLAWYLAGRVLGISGTVKGMIVGDRAKWRVLFLGGMAVGARAATKLLALPLPIEAPLGLTRALVGGVAVGVGTSLGNGCTSGQLPKR